MEITVLLGSIHFAGRLALKTQNQKLCRSYSQMRSVWLVTTGNEWLHYGELFSSSFQRQLLCQCAQNKRLFRETWKKLLALYKRQTVQLSKHKKQLFSPHAPRILKRILLPLCLLHQSQKASASNPSFQPSGKGEAIYAKFNTRLRNFI
jgi:hypothetical protein